MNYGKLGTPDSMHSLRLANFTLSLKVYWSFIGSLQSFYSIHVYRNGVGSCYDGKTISSVLRWLLNPTPNFVYV